MFPVAAQTTTRFRSPRMDGKSAPRAQAASKRLTLATQEGLLLPKLMWSERQLAAG